MKTDDDAFVRVDEVLDSLRRINAAHGLLYGLINSDSRPHRNPESKWYISTEVTDLKEYPQKQNDVFSDLLICLHLLFNSCEGMA